MQLTDGMMVSASVTVSRKGVKAMPPQWHAEPPPGKAAPFSVKGSPFRPKGTPFRAKRSCFGNAVEICVLQR